MKFTTIALVSAVLIANMAASAPSGKKPEKKEQEKILDSKFSFQEWVKSDEPKKGGEKRHGGTSGHSGHASHVDNSGNTAHIGHSGHPNQSGSIVHDEKRHKSG